MERAELPLEVQQNIDMESYRIRETRKGKIDLDRGTTNLDPVSTKDVYSLQPEELEALSRIIAELNERFGVELGKEAPRHSRPDDGQAHGRRRARRRGTCEYT